MLQVRFNDVQQAFDYFGRDNLVPITYLKQACFYIKHGVQPLFVYPDEDNGNRIVYWFERTEETRALKNMWDATKPTKKER